MEKKSCSLYAMEKYEKGKQVYIHYGERLFYDILTFNGFVYQNNENIFFPIIFKSEESNPPLNQKKNEAFKKFDLVPHVTFMVNGFNPDYLIWSRISNSNSQDVKKILQGFYFFIFYFYFYFYFYFIFYFYFFYFFGHFLTIFWS